MNLYLTADIIGTETGGGKVTFHESEALKCLSQYNRLWSRTGLERFISSEGEPWAWDQRAKHAVISDSGYFDLCHIYAGTFSDTVKELQRTNCKVCITCAAHDIEASIKAHIDLGLGFPYPHLTDPDLWKRYSQGYMDCDVLVCPSTVAADTCRKQGRTGRIEIIPHGCDIPKEIKPLPKRYIVGYMGSFGADKGVRYLLETWKKLNYKDGSLLLLAGKDSTSDWGRYLINTYGGGNIQCVGWVKDVSDFYNQISVYVQPSITEGFGIEVLEAMIHNRLVICSRGAGAQDLVPETYRVDAGNVSQLVESIDISKNEIGYGDIFPWRSFVAETYTWDRVRQEYIGLWKGLLNA